MSFKIGSLFSGSGGFELAATLCDIEPVWASEIEPYPIAVTSSRFPSMKHLGDISKVNGAEIEPVDIITFGSPCQDLSVAGKRAGLKHEDNGDDETTRSGLFMEAVRIIKEMRKATNGQYPKFCCWENVPGAFSSNDGEDFRIVLQELIKIAEPYAVMPEVPPKGWAYADSYSGDGWSLAYRVFDAQYWGVPQRRRRIYLVTDFRGGRAEEILFKRKGLRGYFTESGTPWKAVASDVEGSTGTDDKKGVFGFDRYNQCSTGDVSETVRCPNGDNYPTVCYGIISYDSNAMKSDNPHSGVYEADTSRTLDLNGGNPACNQGGIAIVENVPYTLKIRSGVSVDSYGKAAGKGALVQENLSATLGTSNDQYLFQPIGFDGYNATETGDKAKTLNSAASDADHVPCIVYSVENHPADSRVNLDESGKVQTLTSRMGTGGGNVPMVMEPFCKSRRAKNPDDATTWKHADVANTLNTFDQGEARANEVVVYAIDQQGGKGSANYAEDVMPTLCSDSHGTPHGVVYAVDQGGGKSQANVTEEKAPTLTCTHGGEPAVAYGLDRASFNQGANAKFDFSVLEQQQQPTLTAKGPGAVCTQNGHSVAYCIGNGQVNDAMTPDEELCKTLNCLVDPMKIVTTGRRYIVRRLTPTECARLQGFPDKWGHLEPKTKLTDDEYRFWLEVRKTHDAINERAVKDYKPKQMLTWYNKLWTDSAEYKMWGNGIALPCALFVMGGIKDALVNEQITRSKWLDDLLRG